MHSFKYFVENFLTEAQLSKGELTDANGRISEHAFHHAINSYYNKRVSGMSHEQALDELHHQSSQASFKKDGGESDEMKPFKKKLKHGRFDKLYSDTVKSAAHFIHHLHTEGFSVAGPPHATGAGQERGVEEKYGVSSNADVVVPIVKHSTETSEHSEDPLSSLKHGEGLLAGVSLKVSGYGESGKKSASDKLRGPGFAVLHHHISNLVGAVLGPTAKKNLDSLHKKAKSSLDFDEDHPLMQKTPDGKQTKLLAVKGVINSNPQLFKKTDKSGKELLAKITRRIPKGSEQAKQYDEIAKEKKLPTSDELHKHHEESSDKNSIPNYYSAAARALNRVYSKVRTHPDEHGRLLKNFHSEISGIPDRQSKERKVIRIFHVSVANDGEEPKTKVANLPRLLRNAHDFDIKNASDPNRQFSVSYTPGSQSFTIKRSTGSTLFSVSHDRRFTNIKSGSGLMPNKPIGKSLAFYKDRSWSGR